MTDDVAAALVHLAMLGVDIPRTTMTPWKKCQVCNEGFPGPPWVRSRMEIVGVYLRVRYVSIVPQHPRAPGPVCPGGLAMTWSIVDYNWQQGGQVTWEDNAKP